MPWMLLRQCYGDTGIPVTYGRAAMIPTTVITVLLIHASTAVGRARVVFGQQFRNFSPLKVSAAVAIAGDGRRPSMPKEKLKLVDRPAPPCAKAKVAQSSVARQALPRHRSPMRRGADYWLGASCGLAFLLVLPARALLKISEQLAPLHIASYLAVVSSITVWQLRADKRAAQNDEWRVPESRLHYLELAGGWAASFVAQRFLRHKTSKSSYQTTFWSFVALHQYAAVDFVQGWKWTRAIYAFIEPFFR